MIIKEMSMTKPDAIGECINLGVPFLKHYQKLVDEGPDSSSFHHHCKEMQSWWNKVRSITLKPRGRKLRVDQLSDWFFTAGGNIEDYLSGDKALETYGAFYLKLVGTDDVEKSAIYALTHYEEEDY